MSAAPIPVLGEREVRALLPMADCIALVRHAMTRISGGGTEMPLRQIMAIPGGGDRMGAMMGYLDDPASLGIKVVGLFEENPWRGLPSHIGLILMMDPATGAPIGCVDAASVTALRTAAASAVATDALARQDAKTLLIAGTGDQARAHIDAIPLVRPIERIILWGRSRERAERLLAETRRPGIEMVFSGDMEAAVAQADIICTTTSSAEPILRGEWLRAGTHVNLVGSSIPSTAEIDPEGVARGRFFVDYRAAALAQAGELRRAVDAGIVTFDHIVAEIGEVLVSGGGRRDPDDITIYKSLGHAAQDLTSAHHVIAAWRLSHHGGAIPSAM